MSQRIINLLDTQNNSIMSKIKSPVLLPLLCISICSFGQFPKEIPLYPQGIKDNPVHFDQQETKRDSKVNPNSLSQQNRVYSYISEPTYMIFPAAQSMNKHIGVVIFPGGGLVNNCFDKEGTDIAIWLSRQGVTCMVVKYRTNAKDKDGNYIIPFNEYKDAAKEDGRNSILTLKKLADSLAIDKDKIGVLGFSAGGWLIERLIFTSTEGNFDWEPAFAGLIYMANTKKIIKKVKNIEAFPPMFMAIARDDKKVPVKNVIFYLSEIISKVDKSELHIYAKGDHGFGLAYDKGYSVELWKESFLGWLQDILPDS